MTPKGIRNTVLSLFTVAAIAGLMGLIACQGGGGGGKTIVTVGNAKITEGDLDTLARINPRLKPRLATPAGRDKVVDNYVEQEMLYQESVNRGLNRSQDLKDKIALYEKILVAQALLDDELDKKVKEYYNNHQDEFERVKVSHILIKTASPEEKGEKPAEQPKEEKGAKGAKDKAKKPAEPTVAKRSDAEALKLA